MKVISAGLLICAWCFAPFVRTSTATADTSIDVGGAAGPTRVPAWNTAGTGPLPWQGVSTIDLSRDGRLVAVGTMAPIDDPNLFVLDSRGQIVERHEAGVRWITEIAAFEIAPAVAAISPAPSGDIGDFASLFRFSIGEKDARHESEEKPLVFQYGEHSNHLAPRIAAAKNRLAYATPEGIRWSDAGALGNSPVISRYGLHDARVSCLAVTASGRAVVGMIVGENDHDAGLRNLNVLEDGKPSPIWMRGPADAKDVESAPAPPPAGYGPRTKIKDEKIWCPLSVAIDREGRRVASADYQGWERFVLPRTLDESLRPLRGLGPKLMPTRPTIHIYDVDGKVSRKYGPETFAAPVWCDLAFTGDGASVLAYPHHWNCHGLGGQPNLPADDDSRTLYVLPVNTGDVRAIHFPDAIADVASAGPRTAVACWNGRVYLLDDAGRPIISSPDGIDVGAASLVRMSEDGNRIAIGTALGVVRMFDADGHELWKSDLSQNARRGERPWAHAEHPPTKIGPGVWRTGSGRDPSDAGNQVVIEAPDGLILVDPNSGHSFEQNWTSIKAAGLDPATVKYVLPTHEHGDHAPGAYLWRLATGAKVVASPEMAYVLQHDLPYLSGYSTEPPVPVDMIVDRDQDLMLAGLKVRAVRTPGHTYGSMSWEFEIQGRKYVCTGDLIMPGGALGYFLSPGFWAPDVLDSLKKIDALKVDCVIGGHGMGEPDRFIGAGIRAGEATGWSKMAPLNPDPLFGFTSADYQVVGWLENIYTAAFGDIDGDGATDVAILVPAVGGLDVKIYLCKNGRFDAQPDRIVRVPNFGPGAKLRINHLSAGKVADLLIGTDNEAALLLADAGKLSWRVAPIPGGARAASFAADRNTQPPQCIIGQRFSAGCLLCQLQSDGSLKTTGGPRFAGAALELQLADVNGDGKSDLITSAGEIFLRGHDGALPRAASFTLEHPYGQWTFLGVGDFNGDGKPDIVLLGTTGLHTMASVFYNTGNFDRPYHAKADAELDLGLRLEPLRDGPTVADYDGDGIDDLIVGHSQRQDVLIVLGSRQNGLTRQNDIHLKLDYRMHFDTKLGALALDEKGRKYIAGFGYSMVGASGVYIKTPGPSPSALK
jgi:glyoxylase-like metal-dependent hydrolase (beta-lactamase superfamily II)